MELKLKYTVEMKAALAEDELQAVRAEVANSIKTLRTGTVQA